MSTVPTKKTLTYNGKEIKRVYLAGKMSGLSDWGKAAFDAAASELRKLDIFEEVFNPSDNENGDTSFPRGHYMRMDLDYVVNQADAVVVLPNWVQSEGAKTEVRVAQECDKPVFDVESLTLIKERLSLNVES